MEGLKYGHAGVVHLGRPEQHSGDAAPTGATLATPYGLTDQMDITLTGGSVGALAQVQFSGSTVLTDAAVPEPASLILMMTAIPTVAALRITCLRKPATPVGNSFER